MENWRVHLAGWGVILWLFSIQMTGIAGENGYEGISLFLAGYTIGYLTGFSGYFVVRIWKGGLDSLLGFEKGFWRICTSIPLLIIFALGLFGFLNGIFGSSSWSYNVGFFLAGIAATKGLIPIIEYIEGRK